jgi:hypothetical protein
LVLAAFQEINASIHMNQRALQVVVLTKAITQVAGLQIAPSQWVHVA